MSSNNQINIENFFHDIGNGRIFCTLVAPVNPTEECIIYFSPLFEERMWSQRVAFNFARDMAASGRYSVFLFDYFGYGESSGNSEDFTLAGCHRNIESLITMLQQKGFKRFLFWGIRTGCAVALFSIPSDSITSSAFFWAPVFGLREFIYDSLRASIAGQYMLFKHISAKRDTILEELTSKGHCSRDGYILNNIEGYRVGNAFYQETIVHKDAFDPGRLSFPVLIAEIASRTNGQPRSTQRESAQAFPKNIVVKKIVERQFWLIGNDYSQRANGFYEPTIEWLDQL